MNTYNLILTEQQIRLVSESLELRTRLEIGQLKELESFFTNQIEDYDKVGN